MLLVYHDVMDAELCQKLIHEHDTNPNKHIEHPLDQSFDNRVLFLDRMTHEVQQVVARITMEVATALSHHFHLTLYPETVSIVRWGPGDEMAVHRDGQNAHTSKRTHSVVVYLNEQPEGGEIVFPDIGVVVSPRAALMVAYDKTLAHGVRPVQHPRYTLTLWYSDQAEIAIIRQG
jgi:hypothetical protein